MVTERADVAKATEKATQDLLDALRDKDEQIKVRNMKILHVSFPQIQVKTHQLILETWI